MAKIQLPDKLQFLFEPSRYKVAYGGRGGAKSWGFATALIAIAGASCKRILCTREYQNSIQESVHRLITDRIEAMGLEDKFTITQTSITCINGSEFIFAGLKNDPQKIKSTEGVDIVWVEEGQKVSNTSWEILIPTIRQAGSEIWCSYNPDEEHDPTHVRFVLNTPPNAKVVKIGWQDNPWFPAELEAERVYLQKVDPEAYENVWEGETRRHSQGSYYGKHIMAAYQEQRIGNVPPDPVLLTHTFWDLGISDYTCIWFAQFAGKEIHVVDYHEMSGEGLEYYARVLNEKAQADSLLFGEHWAPHDIAARELGSGKSRLDTAKTLGIPFKIVRLARTTSRGLVAEGIESVRQILHKCWFDETRCAMGLKRLKNYRKEWLEKHQCWSDSPVHDENCLTGDTKVLTRYGIHPIMNLPNTGEVQTSCGWKVYHSPRITRRNAPLVEVVFKGGFTVKCTPDHPFLTQSGWRYAELLTPGTLIQSSLTQSRNILTGNSTGCTQKSDTLPRLALNYIGMYGSLLSGIFQRAITSITEIITQPTICFGTLSVCTKPIIYQTLGKKPTETSKNISHRQQGTKPQSGMDQKKEDYGIKSMLNGQKVGSSGRGNQRYAYSAAKNLWGWFGSLIPKNIVAKTADTLIIESVKRLDVREDVWCLSVPDGNAFSLANGAIVHNSHGADAFRTLAGALKLGAGDNRFKIAAPPDRYDRKPKKSRSSAWAA